jgi:hypothetical protein
MSRLEYYNRPLVAFDPANKDHRRYYAEFLEYSGWGHCPVRFLCPEDHGQALPAMIERLLVQYYVDREFGGGKMATERSKSMNEQASALYKKAGVLRKEAAAITKPRRR